MDFHIDELNMKNDKINNGNLERSVVRPRVLERRGVQYVINDLASPNVADSQVIDKMIQDLYNDSLKMAVSAYQTSVWFRIGYLLANLFFIVSTAGIGILSLFSTNLSAIKYIISALGFINSGIQAILTTFSIQSRSVLLRTSSDKLRKISRQVRLLQVIELLPLDKYKKLEQFYTEIDDIDVTMFNNNLSAKTKETLPINSADIDFDKFLSTAQLDPSQLNIMSNRVIINNDEVINIK